jgi:ribonuclease P protein component
VDERPSGTGTRYPKEARLRRDRDFALVRTRGRRHVGAHVAIRSARSEAGRPRLGISSPRRYGGAVERNRFRRVVRAAFRAVAADLPPRDWLVEPRADRTVPTVDGVRADLLAAAKAVA